MLFSVNSEFEATALYKINLKQIYKMNGKKYSKLFYPWMGLHFENRCSILGSQYFSLLYKPEKHPTNNNLALVHFVTVHG